MKVKEIISPQEAQKIFYEAIGIDTDDNLDIGTIDFHSLQNGITTFMQEWVNRVDYYLNVISTLEKQEYSPQYRAFFYERGFTYQEFQVLFDAEIEEDSYFQYPIFEFLQIQSNAQRRHYTRRYQENTLSYVELLQASQLQIFQALQSNMRALLPIETLREHMAIIGGTGTGKSELMKLFIFMLSLNPHNSIIVLDPHGKLVDELKQLDLGSLERLVYLHPFFNADHTPTLNPLELVNPSEREIDIVSQFIVKVFEELLRDSVLTDQMRAILTPCISTLLRKGGASLVDVMRFMDDKENQDLVELGKESPILTHRQFFHNKFNSNRYTSTKISIYTRLFNLLNSPTFYNLVTGKSTFDLKGAMEQGKIVLFNLAEGEMVEDSRIFGKFIIATIQGIAKKRTLEQGKPSNAVYLFVDEFYHYINDSIVSIIKETRKFGVHLIVATQSMGDLNETKLKHNLFDNTAVKVVGRIGHTSTKALSQEIGVTPEQLQSLPNYSFYLKARERTAYQFHSSNMLIRDKKYWRDAKEITDLERLLLKSYYKSLSETTKENEDYAESIKAPKPKFEL